MSGESGYIRRAAGESFAQGLREHVPGTVGLALKGTVLILLATAAALLGLPLQYLLPLVGAGVGGVALHEVRSRRRQADPPPEPKDDG